MSHHHSHKICSNCGTEVQQNFCSKCGQKYLDHKETLGHLFLHFFEDITHFDSRFHKSITPLFFKPGFLTNEYNAGKRTMYLNPVRMYFFVSLVYFLSFLLPQKPLFGGNDNDTVGYSIENDALVSVTRKERNHIELSEMNTNINIGSLKLKINTDSTKIYSKHRIEDSVAKIYDNPKLSFFNKISTAQSFKLSHMDRDIVREEISHDYAKNIPKMMFVLLPLFAFLLKLLYWRRKIYFIDHAIFSIHFHCFVFLNFLLQHLIDFIYPPAFFLNIFLWLGIFVYLFMSMKKVYHQKFGKTFIKFLMLLFSYLIFLIMAFAINGIITLILL